MRSTKAHIKTAQLWVAALALLCTPSFLPGQTTAEADRNSPALIVICFAGGYVSADNSKHGEIRFTQHLEQKYEPQLEAKVFANHHAQQAYEFLMHQLQGDAPALTMQRKASARIVLIGHSWGGSETVAFARRLQDTSIPVQLLVMVDSVKKKGEDDGTIPANVATAINYYQRDGMLHGRKEIHAADPNATKILGNIHMEYKHHPIQTPGYEWYTKAFHQGAHRDW